MADDDETPESSGLVSTIVVYNSLKRVIGFSDIVRGNKAVKKVLEASLNTAAKQAIDILDSENSGDGDVEGIVQKLAVLKIQRAGLASNRLGRVKARVLYEETVGVDLDENLEYIQHSEPAATINPLEPSPQQSSTHHCDEEVGNEGDLSTICVVVLQFSKARGWFTKALLEGPELQLERSALMDAGFYPKLQSGAKVFVPPETFASVVEYLDQQDWDLKPSHVVVAADIETKITTVLAAARSHVGRDGGSYRVNNRTELNVPRDDGEPMTAVDDNEPPYVVKSTFVHIPLPSSMYSSLTIQPSTA